MENNKRKYGLVWDKETHLEDCVLKHNTHTPYLIENKTKEIIGEEGKPSHVLIEGDNFHSLTVMQQTHKNAIDIICIDPPYNTGNEFVYNDKRVDNEDNYRHSKWLNFMDKRMRLSYNLLKQDGVVYCFIGHDELANLTLMMDQIFGVKNRISIISRVTKKGGSAGSGISSSCDFILMYAKDATKINIGRKREEDVVTVGGLVFGSSYDITTVRPNQRYWIQCPDGSFIIPAGNTFPNKVEHLNNINSSPGDRLWSLTSPSFIKELNAGNIIFEKSDIPSTSMIDENKQPTYWRIKRTKVKKANTIAKINNFLDSSDFTSTAGNKEIKELFGKPVFDFPKPTALIKHLIKITNKSNNITVLDFFAGSGTAGQAVIDMNAADNGSRKSIMCAMNDPDDEIDICTEVTYERLKIVTQKWINQSKTELGGWDGFPPTLKYYKIEFIDNTDPLTQIMTEENNKKII